MTTNDHITPGLYGIVPRQIRGFSIETKDTSYLVKDDSGEELAKLNVSATLVLSMCDDRMCIQDILDMVIDMFPKNTATIASEVLTTLWTLRNLKLITLSGCPIEAAPGKPGFSKHTYHINRGDIVPEILSEWGWKPASKDEIAELSLSYPQSGGLRVAKYHCFDIDQTFPLRCKRRIWENVMATGASDIMPKSYTNVDDFLRCEGDTGDLWFFKLSRSTLSKDVHCYRSSRELADKAEQNCNHPYVIQKGIDDTLLIDNRKFKFRVYVVVKNISELYMHEEARVVIQSVPYDRASIDPMVQSDHSESEYRSSDDVEVFSEVFDGIKSIVGKMFDSVGRTFDPTHDPHKYQLFGLDFMVSRSLGPLLLEVNDWPAIKSGKDKNDEGRDRAAKKRILTDMLELVLHGKPGRFQKL